MSIEIAKSNNYLSEIYEISNIQNWYKRRPLRYVHCIQHNWYNQPARVLNADDACIHDRDRANTFGGGETEVAINRARKSPHSEREYAFADQQVRMRFVCTIGAIRICACSESCVSRTLHAHESESDVDTRALTRIGAHTPRRRIRVPCACAVRDLYV